MSLKNHNRPTGADEEDIASDEALSPPELVGGAASNDNVVAPTPTAIRLALHANGYQSVPVSSPYMSVKGAGKRPLMPDWINQCSGASEAAITGWATTQPNCTNTGLLCGDIFAIDVDVSDVRLARACKKVAEKLFGTTLCRIGNAPKLLLPYRADKPFGKLQTPELILPDGTVGRVEVLAVGQQFVGFGIHPATRRPYEWENGQSPFNTPAGSLPMVTREQIVAYLEKVERLLRAEGAKTKTERSDRERVGCKAAGIGADDRPSEEVVEEALGFVPNFDLPYDEWIDVGFALYSYYGAAGLRIWMAWSAQSAKNDLAVSEAKWASFATGHSITIRTLFGMAKRNGWRSKGGKPRKSARSASVAVNHDSNRPVIRIELENLGDVIDAAEAALIAFGAPLYQRGGIIVSPATVVVSAPAKKQNKTYKIVPVNAHRIVELMTAAAIWEKFDARKEGWTVTGCPRVVAETYLSRPEWDLKPLRGIVSHPTLREDGSVLDQPGYDDDTGLLYDPQYVQFPPVPTAPTKEDAAAALKFLMEPFRHFPFVNPSDRAVVLSALLTVLTRKSLRSAPMHCITAPTAGSGKGKIIDCVSVLATGHPASVVALGQTEEETEKRLGASFIAGDEAVAVDNVGRNLSGDFLCQVMTQPSVKIRLLGASKNVEVPTDTFITATGNNLVIEGDMTRRAVICNLDPCVESPEARTFDFDPIEMIRADRGKYVVAALTILRAYHVAGSPQMKNPLGSFEEWSRRVRDALVWLGEADPCESMEKARAADPKRESLTAVVTQWVHVIGAGKRVTAKEIVSASASPVADLGYDGGSSPETEDFREALLAVAGEGSAINIRRLGKWLARNQGRIVNGMKIVKEGGARAGVALWRIDTGAPF